MSRTRLITILRVAALTAATLLVSCNKLDISDHQIKFSASGGSASVTASAGVRFVGIRNLTTHAFEVMVESENWERYPYTLKGKWYTVERTSAADFTVTAERNTSSGTRGFTIYLQEDGFYDEITVFQKGG